MEFIFGLLVMVLIFAVLMLAPPFLYFLYISGLGIPCILLLATIAAAHHIYRQRIKRMCKKYGWSRDFYWHANKYGYLKQRIKEAEERCAITDRLRNQ